MIQPFKGWLAGVRDRFFGDTAGLIELLSSLALLAWAEFFWSHPTIIYRDSYAAFQVAPIELWITVFVLVGLGQVIANLFEHRWRHDLRWVAMACATGLWAIIALTFTLGEVSTTAERMYSLIAMVTAFATVWLAWKSSPNT
jgi:hypothetical protein